MAAVAVVAGFQTLEEFRVVHQRAAIADEGHDGLGEIRCLGREWWEGVALARSP
jgi:hypothetical protein